MNANEIRKRFLDFFASKGHTIVASDSVVPKDDPTVLFTTAGMQQFKRQFLGQIGHYTRAASSQKCVRTDDLDRVGQTAFHHTFFEMLGNFSFGDYFKKEAIQWSWEFLTENLRIPKERLWVSVYQDDQEAKDIWLKVIKFPQQKLVELGDKSNFWPAEAKVKGPNGPCGPCSEIFYDYGVNPQCPSAQCDPSCDCGRFSEIWNLVFTQFNRKDGGILEPLPNKNIDTGMGLERLTAVVQGKKNNFETDLFSPILEAIDAQTKIENVTIEKRERLILADHIRAIVFAINDGVMPSNKERGFVVKSLIHTGANIFLRHGAKKTNLHKLVPAVVSAMQEPYPEIRKKAGEIAEIIQKNEETFIGILKQRIPELKEKIKEIRGPGKMSDQQSVCETLGKLFFSYRDTYGLPLETILSVAQETISENEYPSIIGPCLKTYERNMKEQQDRSRASSKMCGDVFADADLDLHVPKTEFLGYEQTSSQSKILKIFREKTETPQAQKGDEVKIVLDKTPFYAEAGGQTGDTGILEGPQLRVQIHATHKIGDVFIHQGIVETGTATHNDMVTARVDTERRLAIMRNHTATHLLQAGLRKILGTHVQQQGSFVSNDRLRFDFTHPQAISKEQIKQIEDFVNQAIVNNLPVKKEVVSLNQAQNSGALAFFAEKYGETVRVVSIEGASKELCGGTHLASTGQIGLFKITGESAIAQGIRRLEAKTGSAALELIRQQEELLDKISQTLKTPRHELIDRINSQTSRVKQLEKELENFRFEAVKNSLATIIGEAQTVKGIRIITHLFRNLELPLLRKISDQIKQNAKSSITVLGSQTSDNALILISVTDDLTKKGIRANELIGDIAPLINGSGGGNPQLAQAGSKEINKIEKAIAQSAQLIKEKIPS
ncbi:MAG: alanine--tRNA ligase [Candidatus Omnitrophota bacterium]